MSKPKTAVNLDIIRNELDKLPNNPIGLELVRNEMTLMRQEILKSLVDPKRDIDYECGYPDRITLSHFQKMWERDGIGAKLITVWPDESWQLYPEILEGEEAEDTEFEERWKTLDKQHKIMHCLHTADKLSGIGQFGVILLGIADGKELHEPVDGVTDLPLDRREAPDKEVDLLFMRAFSQLNVQIEALEKNSKSPRFGKPTIYKLQWQDNIIGDADQYNNNISKRVHWTRIIHLADNRTSSPIWGIPRLQRVFNNLYNVQKVIGGSGEMFWKGGFPGFSFEINPDVKGDVEFDKEEFRKQLDAWQNGMQRYLTLLNINAKTLNTSIADPNPHLMVQLQAICAAEGLPIRIFLGTEEGKMAGSQDERAWTNRVKFRQGNYNTPYIVRPLIDRFMEIGILPWIDGGEYNIKWPDIAAPSDADKADIASKEVSALAAYISGGVEAIMPPDQFLLQIMKFDQERVDSIMEAAEEFLNSSTMDRMMQIKGVGQDGPMEEEDVTVEKYKDAKGGSGTIERRKTKMKSKTEADKSSKGKSKRERR